MARNRNKPDVKSHPIPDDWAEFIGALAEDPAFQAAWAYAAGMGNSTKGCFVFADNKWQDFQEGGAYAQPVERTANEVQDEIDRLTLLKGRLEGAPADDAA